MDEPYNKERIADILEDGDAWDMRFYGRVATSKPVLVLKCCPDKSCDFCVRAEQREVKWREEYRRRNELQIRIS